MKQQTIKKVVLVFLLIPMMIFSQEFQGKAYYQTKTNVDLKLEDSHMSEEQMAMMQEMLKKQFEKSFILSFNKEASIYKEEEQLDKPQSGNSGIKVMMIGGSSPNEKFYKNTKNETYAREQNLFGKQFLIKDKLKSFDWKLENETKMIGKYLCFKATAKREVTSMEFSSVGDNKDSSEEMKEEKKEQIITAWYTSDIPVNHGPEIYWGLPGLIMELNVDKTQYVCNKIVLNTKDKIEIIEPKKGKEITQEKFNELMEKKMKEMQLNRGRQGKKDGNSFSIQIGG